MVCIYCYAIWRGEGGYCEKACLY